MLPETVKQVSECAQALGLFVCVLVMLMAVCLCACDADAECEACDCGACRVTRNALFLQDLQTRLIEQQRAIAGLKHEVRAGWLQHSRILVNNRAASSPHVSS